MEQFQADVSLDDLRTLWKIREDYSGETKHKIEYGKLDCFDSLTYILSQWMMKKRSLNYYEYCYVFYDCVERLNKRPGQLKEKGSLTRFLLRYPVTFIKDTKLFRKTLIRYNIGVKKVLLNPRSVGSEKWKRFEKFQVTSIYYEGYSKSEFPPLLYIARGYRDKGNSRKVALDASPSWQEVSMNHNFQQNFNEDQLRRKLGFLDLLLFEDRTKELRELQDRTLRKRKREQRWSLLD